MSVSATPASVEKTVVESLGQFGVAAAHVSYDVTFEALDLDSLDLAELSQIIEEEYDVRLTGPDIAAIETVGDAVDLVLSRI
jgi:acyl carrier protein